MKLEGRTARLTVFAMIVALLLLAVVFILVLNAPTFGPPIPQDELLTGLAGVTPTP